MPLGLEAQALTHILKSGLQLPSPDKVGDDPPRFDSKGKPVEYQTAVAEITSTVRC